MLAQLTVLLALAVLAPALLLAAAIQARRWRFRRHWIQQRQHHHHGERSPRPRPHFVGIFHPFCNAGGGGELVLWMALRSLLKTYREADKHAVRPQTQCEFLIYTGDSASREDIIRNAQSRFHVSFTEQDLRRITFVHLSHRWLVEAETYPHFTMLGQSAGSLLLALEALWRHPPDSWLDTMGYAFAYPLVKLVSLPRPMRVTCYVHYPTISTDMLQRVYERRPGYNNDERIARSARSSAAKLAYYRAFALLYQAVGRCTDTVMVNSSWTQGHIDSLWGRGVAHVVFPPCGKVLDASAVGSPTTKRQPRILSIGQFRPEKDHRLQLDALHLLVHSRLRQDARLVLVGSCRNEQDEARVQELRRVVSQLDLDDYVEFRVNASREELDMLLRTSLLGIHTMWNEHFGIGIVEMMAAGVIVVAHNSGGPRSDIVTPSGPDQDGFLASTADEYATALEAVLDGRVDVDGMRARARVAVRRFSDAKFESAFALHTSGWVR